MVCGAPLELERGEYLSEVSAVLVSPNNRLLFLCGSRAAGPRPADHTPFGRLMPPCVRGVCLISSSCSGSLTAATGSNLASRRLQECALRTVPAAPCSAREAVALRGHPLYYAFSDGSIQSDQLRLSGYRPEGYWPIPLGGPIALHCPPPQLRGREEARSAGRWGPR